MADTDYRIKSRTEQIVEARQGRPLPELLRELYHGERRLSQQQIADELGVARTTVIEWMQRYEVPTAYNRSSEAVA